MLISNYHNIKLTIAFNYSMFVISFNHILKYLSIKNLFLVNAKLFLDKYKCVLEFRIN